MKMDLMCLWREFIAVDWSIGRSYLGGKDRCFCSVQVLMIMGVSSIMRSCNTEEAVGVIR